MIGQKAQKPTARQEKNAYEAVTVRDGGICQRCLQDCGRGVTSRHHRKGRGVGGLSVLSNLIVLGGTGVTGCHGFVTEHPAQAILDGWAVPGYADPMSWPARRWLSTPAGGLRLCWVLLGDDCSVTEISEDDAQRLMNGGSSDGTELVPR